MNYHLQMYQFTLLYFSNYSELHLVSYSVVFFNVEYVTGRLPVAEIMSCIYIFQLEMIVIALKNVNSYKCIGGHLAHMNQAS